jgi:surfeit locus 1 family protein
MLPLLVALGFWQLDRAEQKRALQALYAARARDVPVQVTGMVARPQDYQFRPVTVTGRYVPERQVLLDNRVHQGRVGYDVLTPLALEGKDIWVLVDRGWVPLGSSRAELPRATAPQGRVTVEGIAKVPFAPGFVLGKGPGEEGLWTPVVPYVDLASFARHTGHPVEPFMVLLSPAADHGYVRQWVLYEGGPERHEAYAFQWFSLAVALVIIYVGVNLRRRTDTV